MDRTEALIEEVKRRMGRKAHVDHFDLITDAIRIALELYDSGWQPPVDPDVLAVREILAEMDRTAHGMGVYGDRETAQRLLEGEYDNDEPFQAALAAYKKHKNGQVK